jgi:hypothetical protein
MGRRGLGLVVGVIVATALLGVPSATSAPRPPAITFDITPHYVGCYSGQNPVEVLAAWHIVHHPTSATITGAVDARGKTVSPVSVPMVRTRQGVIGSMKLRMRCSASSETLTLTAVSRGGTTTSVATLNENRAD